MSLNEIIYESHVDVPVPSLLATFIKLAQHVLCSCVILHNSHKYPLAEQTDGHIVLDFYLRPLIFKLLTIVNKVLLFLL